MDTETSGENMRINLTPGDVLRLLEQQQPDIPARNHFAESINKMLAAERAEGARHERVASQKLMIRWVPLAWLAGLGMGYWLGVLVR